MQAYDLIMLIVLGMSAIFGAIKGLAWQVASLASIVISYIVAYRYRFQVAEMIEAKPPWNMFLAMLVLYVGTGFVIWVGFRLMSGFIDRIRLKDFDRHLGALFGLGKGLVFCLLITMFAMTLLGPKQQAAICHSRSGYYITKALDKAAGILPHEIHDVVGPYLAKLEDQLKNPQAQQQESPLEGWPSIPAINGPTLDSSNLNPIAGFPGLGNGNAGAGTTSQPQQLPTWPTQQAETGRAQQFPNGQPPNGLFQNGLRSAGVNAQGGEQPGSVFPR